MDYTKDVHKRIDDLTRQVDTITEKLDTLSLEAERGQKAFNTQLRDFQANARDIKDHAERIRTEISRLGRDVTNGVMQAQQQQRYQGQQSYQSPQGLSPDQIAWTVSQAVSQALRSLLNGGGSSQGFPQPQPSNASVLGQPSS